METITPNQHQPEEGGDRLGLTPLDRVLVEPELAISILEELDDEEDDSDSDD